MEHRCSRCGKLLYSNEPKACSYCGHNDFLTEEECNYLGDYRKQLKEYKAKVNHEIERCFNIRKTKLENEFDELSNQLTKLENKYQSLGIFKFSEKKQIKQEIEKVKESIVSNATEVMLLPEYDDLLHKQGNHYIQRSEALIRGCEHHWAMQKGVLLQGTAKENQDLVPYLDKILQKRPKAVTAQELAEQDDEHRLGWINMRRLEVILKSLCDQGLAIRIKGYGEYGKYVYLSTCPMKMFDEVHLDVICDELMKQVDPDSRLDEMASNLGLAVIYDSLKEELGRLLRKQAVYQMSVLANAGAAVHYSKHYSPTLLGGLTNALAGPVSGILVAHQAVVKNAENELKRKESETQRDDSSKVANSLIKPIEIYVQEKYQFEAKLRLVNQSLITMYEVF